MGPQGNVTHEGPGETRTGLNAARKTERPLVREYVDAGSASGRFTSPDPEDA